MKQAICLLVAALIVAAIPWDDGFTREAPWGLRDPGQGSDDHTWGGEATPGDPGPDVSSLGTGSEESGTIIGVSAIDFFFQKFLQTIWSGKYGQYGNLAGYSVVKEIPGSEDNTRERVNHSK